MNMSVSLAAAAVGLAALLGISGSAYMDLRNQLNSSEDRIASLVSERDNLNKEVESLQQQLTQSKQEISNLRTQMGKSQTDMRTSQAQVKTLSVCLKGVVETMNQLSEGNNGAALLTLSSVYKDCQQADTIIQQQNSSENSSSSEQAPPIATTGVIY